MVGILGIYLKRFLLNRRKNMQIEKSEPNSIKVDTTVIDWPKLRKAGDHDGELLEVEIYKSISNLFVESEKLFCFLEPTAYS